MIIALDTISLGMQLILDKSLEFLETSGLSLISGEVTRISDKQLCIPNIVFGVKLKLDKVVYYLTISKKKGIMFLLCPQFFL